VDVEHLMQIIEGTFANFSKDLSNTVDDVHYQLRDLGTSTMMGLTGTMINGVQELVTSMLLIHAHARH
jgi:hypothetical protein